MKKRSLFAAVAMLIVSAMVLTSATYAWFASGTKASVGEIKASVSKSDGTLLVATDLTANSGAGNWKTDLTYADWQNVTGNVGVPTTNAGAQVPTELHPISVAFTNDAVSSKIAGGISQDTTTGSATYGQYKFAATGNATTNYIDLTFYVKATSACVVDVEPTFNNGSVAYIYGAITSNGSGAAATSTTAAVTAVNSVICGDSAGYYPVVVNNGVAVDNNTRNSIVDTAEDDSTNPILGSQVTPSAANSTLKFVITEAMAAADQYVTVHIYIWAEGQHASCTGNASAGTASMSLSLTKSNIPTL